MANLPYHNKSPDTDVRVDADADVNAERLRVMIVSESSLGGEANGVANSVRRELEYLHGHGHEALVLAPRPRPAAKAYAGYTVESVSSASVRGFSVGTAQAHALRGRMQDYQPDIVHLASPFLLGRAALKAARRLNLPTVAVYQTDVAQYARRFGGDLVDKGALKKLKWLRQSTGDQFEEVTARHIARLHNRADMTLAPSQAAINRLVSFGVDPEKIFLWRRGVDTQLFSQDRKQLQAVHDLRAQWSADGAKTIVGYVGRLAPEKEVEKLAVLDDLDTQLVIVGDGISRSELERRLPAGTVFTGELTGDDLANAYAAFDLFVHTGRAETFGQTLQEAMASGVPVIAPASGGPLDIVQPGYNGFLFAPDDAAELQKLVRETVLDPHLRLRLGEQALHSIAGKSWEAVNDQLIEHYRSVMPLPARAA